MELSTKILKQRGDKKAGLQVQHIAGGTQLGHSRKQPLAVLCIVLAKL